MLVYLIALSNLYKLHNVAMNADSERLNDNYVETIVAYFMVYQHLHGGTNE